MDLNAYVDSLNLNAGAPIKKIRNVLTVEPPRLPLVDDQSQSFISERSIISFGPDVSEQTRSDVLNATLLAQMAANYQHPNESELTAWYKAFIDTLSKTGWLIEEKDVQSFKSKSNLTEVENVIIEILKGVFGSTYIEVIQKTLDAIKSLNSQDRRIKAFERNVSKVSKGCFQIALATELNGQISLKIGTFILHTTHNFTSILFVRTTTEATSLEYISQNAALNQEQYSRIREKVSKKLGDALFTNIDEIDIA